MKAHADKHRTDVVFAEGDMVFVKLQPYRQASLAGEYHKLSKKYYRPYKISKRIGQVAYVLQLPERSRIHNTFHVSCLKPAYGSVLPSLELPPRVFHNNPILDPLRILDSRVVLRQGQPIRQILVQWLGLPQEDTSWEGFTLFTQLYPQFHLEDKVLFQQGETFDTTQTRRNRRKPRWLKDYE